MTDFVDHQTLTGEHKQFIQETLIYLTYFFKVNLDPSCSLISSPILENFLTCTTDGSDTGLFLSRG
jgi:hypothetical protein